MLPTSLFIVLTINSVQSQINGEFWWLNKKLNNFRNGQPTEPEFEVLSEFDNDESAKIVFRENDLLTNKLTKPVNHRIEKQSLYDHTNNEIVWPTNDDNGYNKAKENTAEVKPKDLKNKIDDEFVFTFPKNEKYIINVIINSNETVPQSTKKNVNELSGDRVSSDANKDKEAQHICSYYVKKECVQSKGVIYSER